MMLMEKKYYCQPDDLYTPKIWTFDHFFGIDVQMGNIIHSSTPKKWSNDRFFGVMNLSHHISLSFFDMEAIWFVIIEY